MEFYAPSKGKILPVDMETFTRVVAVIREMPNIVFDSNEHGWGACKNQVSCHLICHALAAYFEVSVYDGYFATSHQHSWLIPLSRSSIIDVYPIAGAVPFIVAADRASPWVRLYRESSDLQPNFVMSEFLDRLEKTKQVMSETIKRLGFKPSPP
jgi:hypothetical protein